MKSTLFKAISLGTAIGLTGLGVGGCGGATGSSATSGGQASSGGTATAPAGPVSMRGQDRVEADIGPAGGTLELANGARITIPAGALPETVTMTLSNAVASRIFEHREDQVAVGPAVQLTPVFATAVAMQISVPFQRMPPGYASEDLAIGVEILDNQRALSMGGVQTRWQLLLAQNQSGRLQAEIAESHGMRLQFVAAR